MSRTYRWQTENQRDQSNFISELIQLFRSVAGGAPLDLVGVRDSSEPCTSHLLSRTFIRSSFPHQHQGRLRSLSNAWNGHQLRRTAPLYHRRLPVEPSQTAILILRLHTRMGSRMAALPVFGRNRALGGHGVQCVQSLPTIQELLQSCLNAQ